MLRRILTTSLFFVLALGTAWAADVTLQTDDGVKLHAVYNPVKSATRGVVLVHMAGRSAEDWAFIATKLNQSGVATLAVDLRGHGGNVSPTSSPTTLTEADYQKMQKDVAAAVAHLRKQGVTDVSLMGASIGANLCLQVAAADPNIKSVVMLSPGMNFKGVMLSEALTTYGDRSLLVVAAVDDSYSAKTAQYIQDAARSRQVVQLFSAGGHGTKMLNRVPELEPLVMSWLLGTYRIGTESGVVGSNPNITTTDTTKVETTGTTFGSK
ncbi:MAG: alpha/beta fold hydrolase [Deltaproteobacteria bacterium]|nr:alpha/beta fold hydrolase [Deltaproteobacteria bacterium]